jgi:hypothetical protein
MAQNIKSIVFIFILTQLPFAEKISFNLFGKVDSIILHYEGLKYCTSADTIDSCEININPKFFSKILPEFSNLSYFTVIKNGSCCGEKRIAYFEVFIHQKIGKDKNPFYLSKSFKIFLWDCIYNKYGYIYLNDELFLINFSDSLAHFIENQIEKHKVKVFTLSGKIRLLKDRDEILNNTKPYLDHVNKFDKYLISQIEEPEKHIYDRRPEGSLASMKALLERFKKEMDINGLEAIWDTTKNEYYLKWKNDVNFEKTD